MGRLLKLIINTAIMKLVVLPILACSAYSYTTNRIHEEDDILLTTEEYHEGDDILLTTEDYHDDGITCDSSSQSTDNYPFCHYFADLDLVCDDRTECCVRGPPGPF